MGDRVPPSSGPGPGDRADEGYAGLDDIFGPYTDPDEPQRPDEPARTVPTQTEKGQTEKGQTEKGQTEKGQAEPAHAEPAQMEPDQARPAQTAGRKVAIPISLPDLALVAGLLAVVVMTAVLVRAAVQEPAATGAGPRVRSAMPAPPADAPREGSYVETRVSAEGDVRVRQWVRSTTPLAGVRLELPLGAGRSRPLTATDVSVAGDQAVLNPPRAVGATEQRLYFGAPPRVVYVGYTLKGALDRSPSARARALVRATGLHVERTPLKGPTRVTVVAGKVLGAACRTRTSPEPRPCGSPGRASDGTTGTGSWSVLLRGPKRTDIVVAQVDLR